MSRPKSHHYITRGILRGFAVAGTEQVWVYFPDEKPFLTKVENIACEKFLYAVGDDVDPRNVMVESKFFSVVDAPIPRIVRDMMSRRLLGIDDRKSLGIFTAAQIVRTPSFRDNLHPVYKDLNVQQLLEHIVATFKHAPQIDPSTFAPTPLTEQMQQNFFVMNALNEIDLKWKMLSLRKWRLCHTTNDVPFITSSVGLGFDRNGPGDDVTLQDDKTLIYFPLSSTVALEISTPMKSTRDMIAEHVDITPFEVRHICRAVAFAADQFVISNSPNYRLPKIWCNGEMNITPAKPLPRPAVSESDNGDIAHEPRDGS